MTGEPEATWCSCHLLRSLVMNGAPSSPELLRALVMNAAPSSPAPTAARGSSPAITDEPAPRCEVCGHHH